MAVMRNLKKYYKNESLKLQFLTSYKVSYVNFRNNK